jgi:parallel beta-helix repeat protein
MSRFQTTLLACLLSCATLPGATITVSPNGNDANDGSPDSPVASFIRARELIRQLKTQGVSPLQVVVKPGLYRFKETFSLTKEDAGTPEAPIRWIAEKQGTARILGSTDIPKEAFQKVTDPEILKMIDPHAAPNILVADLHKLGFPKQSEMQARPWAQLTEVPELFFENKRMQLARWPDDDWTTIEKIVDGGSEPYGRNLKPDEIRGGTFKYMEDRPKRWNVDRGVWVRGYWCFDWAEDVQKVKSIDTVEKTITMEKPSTFGLRQGNPSPRRWYALNLLEELSKPGEFYIDHKTQLLYFWPPAKLDGARVSFNTQRGLLVNIDNTANIVWKGFLLEESNQGISVNKSENITIEGCEVRNMHNNGIAVYGSKNNKVLSCDIHDTGTGGVVIGGGNRKTLEPGNSLVENCHIWKFSVHKLTYSNGITLSGVGNAARHNEIHDAPHMAVGMGANDCIFEYNVVHHVCLAADDSGALYKGRNPSLRGNIVRYNLWYSIGKPMGHGVAAVYFDDGDVGETVTGNLFFRCGDPGRGSFGTVFSHGGHELVADNNVFIECKRPLGSAPWGFEHWKKMIDGDLWQTRLLKEVDITKPPYITHYPTFQGFMDPKPEDQRVSHAYRNLFVMCAEEKSGNWILDESNWSTSEDPGFVDINKGNFNFKEDAIVFEKIPGFKPLPVDKMGLYACPERPVVNKPKWDHEPPRQLPPIKKITAKPAATRKNPNPPTWQVEKTTTPPTIDAIIKPDEWNKADTMQLQFNYNGKDIPKNRQSQAWITYDDDNLYIATNNQFDPKTKLDGNQWGRNDAVEIAIRPPKSKTIHVIRGYGNGYLQYGVTENAAAEPLAQEPAPIQFAANRTQNDAWTTEFKIPFEKIGIPKGKLPKCAFNITVRKSIDDFWCMWESTLSNSYNVEAAGFIVGK